MMDGVMWLFGGLCLVALVLGCGLVLVSVTIISSQMSKRGK